MILSLEKSNDNSLCNITVLPYAPKCSLEPRGMMERATSITNDKFKHAYVSMSHQPYVN